MTCAYRNTADKKIRYNKKFIINLFILLTYLFLITIYFKDNPFNWDLHTLAFLIISLILSPPFSLPPWVDLYTPLFVLWKECLEWTQLKILTLKVWRSKNYIPRGLSWQDYELQSQVSWSFQIFGKRNKSFLAIFQHPSLYLSVSSA